MIKVSLFSQILAHFPREKFDSLVKKHKSDKYSKGIKSWTHLVSMLFCQIAGACSVRDISHGLRSITGNMYNCSPATLTRFTIPSSDICKPSRFILDSYDARLTNKMPKCKCSYLAHFWILLSAMVSLLLTNQTGMKNRDNISAVVCSLLRELKVCFTPAYLKRQFELHLDIRA